MPPSGKYVNCCMDACADGGMQNGRSKNKQNIGCEILKENKQLFKSTTRLLIPTD